MKNVLRSLGTLSFSVLLCTAGWAAENEVVSSVVSDSLQYSLDDVEISANRIPLLGKESARVVTIFTAEDIASTPVHSVNDLLEYLTGVDVRQRGEMGVQSDISVRGGTFDQVTILLNGFNISSPQTGHHSADFPVSMQDIERIEVLQGPAARVFGTSAFTGAVNIITKSASKGGNVHLYGGDFGLAGAEARYSAGTDRINNNLSLGYGRSDGATPNSDYNQMRAFYNGDSKGADYDLNWQFGYSNKHFGANTFYGAASTDQWESNERVMAAFKASGRGQLHLTPSAYWNRWYDHYQWHRDSPAGENFHQVDVYGLNLNSWFQSSLGKSSIGLEMRNENILSSKLGKPLEADQYVQAHGSDNVFYKFQDNRTNLSAFVEHNIIMERWTASLGVLANMNTALDNKFRLYPGIDVSYRPTETWKLFASWNMALRMPTFTDLYYSGPNIKGNDHLKPEKRSELTAGARMRVSGVELQANAFISHNSDMIDWVIYQGDVDKIFNSCNFEMDNYGVEVSANIFFRELSSNMPLNRLTVSYAYIEQDMSYARQIESSKYSLEYLRHKVVAKLDSRIYGHLNGWLSWRWQERTGQSNSSYGLVSARLSYDKTRYSLYLEADNLLDKKYFDYSYIPQPGLWVKGGIVINLK